MRADVTPFHHAHTGTWSYVVADPATRRAAIIDPVLDFDAASGRTSTAFAGRLLAHVRAQGLQVDWLLETHTHADHLSAVQWLKSQCPDAVLAIGEGIRQTQRRFAPVFNLGQDVAADGSQFDRLFSDDDMFRIGAIDAQVMATPGHTADCIAYVIGDAVFTGDSLFMPDAGSARCDFPGGDAAVLFQSIQRLYALPDQTRMFVCHDYGPDGREVECETTIGMQKRDNIHARGDTVESDFVALRQARDATLSMPALLLPALQVNIRGGALPPAENNGVRYLKLPLDRM